MIIETLLVESNGTQKVARKEVPENWYNNSTPPHLEETEVLQAQIKALTDRNEFMEDCIAEMAMQVYQ